jgi:hypothetical protein
VVSAVEFAIELVAPIVWLEMPCGKMRNERRKTRNDIKTIVNFILYLS